MAEQQQQGWTWRGGSGNWNDNWLQEFSRVKRKCGGDRKKKGAGHGWWQTIELHATRAGARAHPHPASRGVGDG
jgi:hypothetical protein